MMELMLTFFEVSWSIMTRKDTATNDDAGNASKIVISGLHMSINFLTQAPISALRMSPVLSYIPKVRLGIVTFKIFPPDYFQTGRHLI